MPFQPSHVLGASDPAFPARAMILELPPGRQHALRQEPDHDPFPVEPETGTAWQRDGSAIDKAMVLVDYRNLSLTTSRVAFERRGMGITLNGIAQGYITDRVADLLRNEGLDDVLVDLGEIRGLGRHADGRPWTVGLKDPLEPGRIVDTLTLENQALASSAGAATRFDLRGRHHHLFDPHSGTSANRYLGITVIAPTATTADALSTGFASMDLGEVKKVLQRFSSVTARITMSTGELMTL